MRCGDRGMTHGDYLNETKVSIAEFQKHNGLTFWWAHYFFVPSHSRYLCNNRNKNNYGNSEE